MSAPALKVTLLALFVFLILQITCALPLESRDSPVLDLSEFIQAPPVQLSDKPVLSPSLPPNLRNDPIVLPTAKQASRWVETWTA